MNLLQIILVAGYLLITLLFLQAAYGLHKERYPELAEAGWGVQLYTITLLAIFAALWPLVVSVVFFSRLVRLAMGGKS